MSLPLDERLALLSQADTVLVSACLLGGRVRFDGAHKHSERVARALAGKAVVPLCPEVGSGLPVPRPPVHLTRGDGDAVLAGEARARTLEGALDLTVAFLAGARLALAAAERHGARVALLKEKSPSCGSRAVYVDGRAVSGRGVAAALLTEAGYVVVSDDELP